jgi:replicative DNA helicase
MWYDGWAKDDIVSILSPIAEQHEFPSDELERVVRSVTRYERKEPVGSVQGGSPTPDPVALCSPVEFLQSFDKRDEGTGEPELPTGFKRIDKHAHILTRGNLLVLAARPSAGKTVGAITVSGNLCRSGRRVLYFSTEMAAGEIYPRFVSASTGVPEQHVRDKKLSPGDTERLTAFREEFGRWNLRVCDEAQPDLKRVADAISEFRPDVFVFDHVQRVPGVTEKRHTDIERFVKGLKNLSRQYGCAGIVVSQLNRAAELEPVSLRHLAECGSIEQEAAYVLAMTKMPTPPGTMTYPVMVQMLKGRFAGLQTFEMKLNGPITRLEE